MYGRVKNTNSSSSPAATCIAIGNAFYNIAVDNNESYDKKKE